MNDLVTWLRAQLDEDERVTRAGGAAMGMNDPGYPDYPTYTDDDTAAASAYLMHFSPIRLLAEVEAKRRLLGLHKECTAECYVVRVLALPYADHPGYLEEWRP